jgi:hypothetical protein
MRIAPNVSIPVVSQITAQSGRMSLPVDPSILIYSHFENVFGTAAPQGTQGATINQLKLLDVLIRQLSALKDDASFLSLPASGDDSGSAAHVARMEALVETYRNQVLQTRAASAAMPYISAPQAPSGAVFSLVA